MTGVGRLSEISLTVLHVDDDALNRRVVAEVLSAFGHRSVQASNGEEALAWLSAQLFDAILLDIHMPGLSGVDVIQRLRSSLGPERRTPVIAVSADLVSRNRADYLKLGFDDFVPKPISVTRLQQSLIRLAQLPPAGRDPGPSPAPPRTAGAPRR